MEVSEIGQRLRAAGRTQTELARFLGISKSHVSFLLKGQKRMALDTYRKIEAFLAEAERKAQTRGVAESTPAPFAHAPSPLRFITLEEARALKANPPPRLPPEERERIIQELIELGDAYRALPRETARSEDDILGYAEDGLPEQ